MKLIERPRTIAKANSRTVTNYRDFKEPLRWDFHHSCAYCGVWESQANGSTNFAVEHFVPKSIEPDLKCDPNNLLYACKPCNDRKYTKYPYDDGRGWKILDPCTDDLDDHYTEKEDGMLDGFSSSGKAMIEKFRLNHPDALRQRCLRRNVREAITQVHQHRKFCSNPGFENLPPDAKKVIKELINHLSETVKSLLPRRMSR